MKAHRSFIVSVTAALAAAFWSSDARGYFLYDATPGVVITMTQNPPASGTYVFTESYNWRDENGVGSDDILGSWASRTKDYRGYQSDGVGNTVLLEDASMYVEYEFILPVDDSYVTSITLDTVMNGSSVKARFLNHADNNWYSLSPVTTGGAGFTLQSAAVPAAAWNNDISGQVGLNLWIVQEGAGGIHGIDEFTLTATTVPEPAALSLLGLGAIAVLRRRK